MREGWWLCALKPWVTYRMVERQQRIIDVLRADSTRRAYALSWCHAEIGELTRRLAQTRAALAGDEAIRASLRSGDGDDAVIEAGVKAYDETLWLEREARDSWVERERAWVDETLAAIEAQRQEAEDA